ncbi:MAG: GNAT family N-acetyltransferase [Woeseiaceae bacterium]
MKTERLVLKPMSHDDFELFVRDLLTDPKVVEHYHSYHGLFDLQMIRVRAEKDFWDHFEESRAKTGLEIWSVFETYGPPTPESFIGWAGLIHTELSDEYGGPELQYMLTSRVFGRGLATEAAAQVMQDAIKRRLTPTVIATVDKPNKGSIRVLEKLGFEFVDQIYAYESPDMQLYKYEIS